MVLHRERRKRLVADALDRVVVEIDVRHFQTVGNRFRQHREVVVLARNLHLAGREILHWMVAAMMSELETPRLGAARKRQQLMAETDAHDGDSWQLVVGGASRPGEPPQ